MTSVMLDEPVRGIVFEGGKAAKGVRDLGNLEKVCRVFVGQSGHLSDRIGNSDQAKICIVGQ